MVAGNVEHAHNEFLQIWAELGLVGFLLFMGLLGSVFFPVTKFKNEEESKPGISQNKAILLSAKASLIAILVSALFAFPLHIFPTLINFFFLLAVIAFLDEKKTVREMPLSPRIIKSIVMLFLFLSVWFAWYSFEKYNIYREWEKADRLMQFNQYESAIANFERLYPELNQNGEFLFRYGGALTALGNYEKAISVLETAKGFYSNPNLYMVLGEAYEETGQFSKAIDHYKFSWNIIPHKMYPLYRMFLVNQKTGNQKESRRLAQQIITMQEKIETTAGKQIKEEVHEFLKISTLD